MGKHGIALETVDVTGTAKRLVVTASVSDALRAEAVSAAREQLASIDPTDAYIAADRLARLLLQVLGETP